MIRLVRPEIPRPLAKRGPESRRQLIQAFNTEAARYTSGELSLPINRALYGHQEVRQALLAMQHGKYYLCESRIGNAALGDAEHFRPKGGFRQAPDTPLERPGYFWLAYDWDNLFIACEVCNQSFKKNLFPLFNPEARARRPEDDHAREEPVFVDPAREDPAQFISFRATEIYAIDGNERGLKTIEWLGLNRYELKTAREEHYEQLKLLYRLVHHIPQVRAGLRERAMQRLSLALAESAPYLAMVRTAMAAEFETPYPPIDPPTDEILQPPRSRLRRRRF